MAQVATAAREILALMTNLTPANADTIRAKAARIVSLADPAGALKPAAGVPECKLQLDRGALGRALGLDQADPDDTPGFLQREPAAAPELQAAK
jgi:hypothetical protein